MNIVILDDYQDVVRKLDCAQLIAPYPCKVYTNSAKGTGQLALRLRDADVLVTIRERTQISKLLLDKLPRLKLISQTGRVGAHIDVPACTERKIAVAEGLSSPQAPAELTWALIMAASKRLPQYITNLKHGVWQQSGLRSSLLPTNFALPSSLHGKTLGIMGYGRIGRLVAQYGRAFGMNVITWGGRAASAQRAQEDGVHVVESKQALMQQSDVLTLHLRLTPETEKCISQADLKGMKPTAIFVNTARAELLQTEALVSALNHGRPGMAAIDVYESEPLLQGYALLRLENCICTPHLGYVEKENYETYFESAFKNVVNFIEGRPSNIANPPALGRAAAPSPPPVAPTATIQASPQAKPPVSHEKYET
jgi:D-3-phosphoglycerate dehydrogenase / 2-oxoglutarate reductase